MSDFLNTFIWILLLFLAGYGFRVVYERVKEIRERPWAFSCRHCNFHVSSNNFSVAQQVIVGHNKVFHPNAEDPKY